MRLTAVDISVASRELFKTIMASDDLTDQHWEAARLVVHRAFQRDVGAPQELGEPERILEFLDYHLGLLESGEDHNLSINLAIQAIVGGYDARPDPPTVECIRNFNCVRPPFVRGLRYIIHPNHPSVFQADAIRLISLVSNQWFDPSVPVMRPEEMTEFCEHLAAIMDNHHHHGSDQTRRSIVTILFGMLRSPIWRKHIVTRLWSAFAYCGLVEEEEESFRWCLRNAIELLEFMRGLPDGEGLKWWYVTLWFHYDKLDATVRDEAERMARDMSRSHGVSDLNLYLNLIGREVVKIRGTMVRWESESDMSMLSGLGAQSGSDVSSGSNVSSGSDVSSESDVELSESDVDPVK